VTVYINGIKTTPEEAAENRRSIAKLTGRPVHEVFNPSDGLIKDVSHCLGGIFNSRLGMQAEEESALCLKEKLLSLYKEGKKTQLFVHSQGSIIAANVLETIREEMSPDDWKDFTRKIYLVGLGPANHVWPRELKVFSFNNSMDLVSQASRILAPASELLRDGQYIPPSVNHRYESQFDRVKDIISIIRTEGLAALLRPHSVDRYCDSFSEHIYEKFSKSGEKLSKFLKLSIANGWFTDELHREIIGMALNDAIAKEPQAVSFLKAFFEGSPKVQIGEFAYDFRTDFFQLQQEKALRAA
jgi:hypothetical protein